MPKEVTRSMRVEFTLTFRGEGLESRPDGVILANSIVDMVEHINKSREEDESILDSDKYVYLCDLKIG